MPQKKNPNIVLLTFDSGRSDRVGFLGYCKNTTPFLDSLAEEGVCFKRAFATGAGSPQSFVGIFTSTYPLDYGGYSYVKRPRVLLSEALRESGYKTVGVHSSAYLSSYFGYDRGWDEFRYVTHFRSRSVDGAKSDRGRSGSKSGSEVAMSPGLRKDTVKAGVLRKSALVHRWLKKHLPPLAVIFKITERTSLFFRKVFKDIVDFKPGFYTADEINEEIKRALPKNPDKPLFLWAHYLDAHAPYGLFMRKMGFWPKVKYHLCDALLFLFADSRLLGRIFLPLFSSLYDDSLRYVDENIKHILEYFKRLGIDEKNSIFIFCADHGEAFYEHGTYGHSQRLFDVNLHVPLLLYGPRHLANPQSIGRPVSLIDLAPTILSFAGARVPRSYRGRSVFDEEERDVVSQASESEGDLSGALNTGITIIRSGYKLIHWKNKRYLFSLDDEGEKNNLYDVKKDVVYDLEERLKNYAPH